MVGMRRRVGWMHWWNEWMCWWFECIKAECSMWGHPRGAKAAELQELRYVIATHTCCTCRCGGMSRRWGLRCPLGSCLPAAALCAT